MLDKEGSFLKTNITEQKITCGHNTTNYSHIYKILLFQSRAQTERSSGREQSETDTKEMVTDVITRYYYL